MMIRKLAYVSLFLVSLPILAQDRPVGKRKEIALKRVQAIFPKADVSSPEGYRRIELLVSFDVSDFEPRVTGARDVGTARVEEKAATRSYSVPFGGVFDAQDRETYFLFADKDNLVYAARKSELESNSNGMSAIQVGAVGNESYEVSLSSGFSFDLRPNYHLRLLPLGGQVSPSLWVTISKQSMWLQKGIAKSDAEVQRDQSWYQRLGLDQLRITNGSNVRGHLTMGTGTYSE